MFGLVVFTARDLRSCPVSMCCGSRLICHQHGLVVRIHMNDATFGQSSFTNLDFSDDVCLPAELRVLDLLLPALATEAASLGLDVNWQCTRKGAFVHSSIQSISARVSRIPFDSVLLIVRPWRILTSTSGSHKSQHQ